MTLVDTGPLVALLNKSDLHHEWAVAQTKLLRPPLVTCEAVLTEAFFLIGGSPKAVARLFDLLELGFVKLEHRVADCIPETHELMAKYRNVAMSFADACIVLMSEVSPEASMFTIDSDFHIYRRSGREMIPVVMPS